MAYPAMAVGISPTVMQGMLQQGQLSQPIFSFYFSRFALGSQATGWGSQDCQAIVDTGTFLLAVPLQYMNAFLQATGAQQAQNGDFVVSCGYLQDMPIITFVISGSHFPLPPYAYVFSNNGYCQLGMEASYLPTPSGQPLWMLGDVFLKEYYSVYDTASNRVGFAYSA